MVLAFKILFKEFYSLISTPNGREFLKLAFKYGDDERYKSTSVTFNNYKLNAPDSLSFIWQYKDIFADENYKFHSDNSNPVIYDCGANIGMSCIYFKQLFPNARITAFEANPEIAKILDGNLKENRISGVEIIPKAVWIHDDGIEISSDSADASSIYGEQNKTKVESIRLKDFLKKENVIDMLKIDIEGAEAEVMKDCDGCLDNVKHMFIEYHSYLNIKQELGDILQILTKNNFRYFIRHASDRSFPFINRISKHLPDVDVQLNIYAYK